MSSAEFENEPVPNLLENRPELAPFSPPVDFDHGSEFADEAPRSIPEFTRRSRYIRARRTTVLSLALVAGACLATHELSFVRTMSWYLLPLGYLNWIGWGLVAIAVIYWIRNLTTRGLLEYIRSGQPLVGRVRQVGVNVEGTEQAQVGRFIAQVELPNPYTGLTQEATVSAPETFGLSDAPKMNSGVVPGDYVTLVYLLDNLEKSLQMYGWLGLNPNVELLQKNGKPLKVMSPMAVLMIVVGVMAAGWALLAFLYVLGRYTPHNDERWSTFVIYAIGIGLASIPFVFVMTCGVKREGETITAVITKYGLAVLFGVFGGFMIGFPTVGFLNGYFDRSPTHFEPVKVVQLWNQTFNFVIRTYEIEYHPFPAGKTEKKTVTVETLSSFKPDSLGVIDVGKGWLGIQWLREFHPIGWEAVPIDDTDPSPDAITFQMPNVEQPMRITPRVIMGEDSFLPPPDVLLPELRSRMKATLTSANAKIIEAEKP